MAYSTATGATKLKSTNACSECPRALLCIARPADQLLPLATCNQCGQVVEVDRKENLFNLNGGVASVLSSVGDVHYYPTNRTELAPVTRAACPRTWVFYIAPLGVVNGFKCLACGGRPFVEVPFTGMWRWGGEIP